MTARLARDEAYLQEEAQRAVERAKTPNGYSRTELAALPTAILVRALERILRVREAPSRRQFIWNRRRRWSARGAAA